MTTTTRLRTLQLILAGAAAFAMLALFDAAHPDAATFGQLRLTDTAIESPLPQSPPNLAGGGFAADSNDDQAQLQQQLAQQQMQQSMQQAQEQNDEAEQQFNQDMQQQQTYENQFNNP